MESTESLLIRYTEWLVREWGLDLYDAEYHTMDPEDVVSEFIELDQ